MSDGRDSWVRFLAFVINLAATIIAVYCGYLAGQSGQQQEAVRAGAARWEVDPATGNTRFVYTRDK